MQARSAFAASCSAASCATESRRTLCRATRGGGADLVRLGEELALLAGSRDSSSILPRTLSSFAAQIR